MMEKKNTQICDKCVKENDLIELGDGYILNFNENQGGICAVNGCHNKAEHYIEFYVDEDKTSDLEQTIEWCVEHQVNISFKKYDSSIPKYYVEVNMTRWDRCSADTLIEAVEMLKGEYKKKIT